MRGDYRQVRTFEVRVCDPLAIDRGSHGDETCPTFAARSVGKYRAHPEGGGPTPVALVPRR